MSPGRLTDVYAALPLTRAGMISTGVAARPGRTRAGTPHPARNRRCATAYGGPGPTTTAAETGLDRVRGWAWQRAHRTLRTGPMSGGSDGDTEHPPGDRAVGEH